MGIEKAIRKEMSKKVDDIFNCGNITLQERKDRVVDLLIDAYIKGLDFDDDVDIDL